jgi:hypothetical protein
MEKMPLINIYRIPQWDFHLRKYTVYCDGSKAGSVGPGEAFSFEVSPGPHKISVKVLPYYSKKFVKEFITGETTELTTGYIYKHYFIDGLNPNAVKLLPTPEFEKLKYKTYPEDIRKNKTAAFYCLAASVIVLILTLAPGHFYTEYQDLIFLTGISQLAGSIILIKKEWIPGKNFLLWKPFLGAGFILFLALILSENIITSALLITVSLILITAGIYTFRHNR